MKKLILFSTLLPFLFVFAGCEKSHVSYGSYVLTTKEAAKLNILAKENDTLRKILVKQVIPRLEKFEINDGEYTESWQEYKNVRIDDEEPFGEFITILKDGPVHSHVPLTGYKMFSKILVKYTCKGSDKGKETVFFRNCNDPEAPSGFYIKIISSKYNAEKANYTMSEDPDQEDAYNELTAALKEANDYLKKAIIETKN